jgi:hypothetical protein
MGMFTWGCFRVDPVNEIQQVLLLPTNNLQALNSELVTLEGLFNELEETELKSKKRNTIFYIVLGVVAIIFIMKGLKPEFIFGSTASKKGGGDLMPTSDIVETQIVPSELSAPVIDVIEIPTHEIDTRVVSFQPAESTVSMTDVGTSIDTAGALSIKSGKLIHGVIDDLCLIQK